MLPGRFPSPTPSREASPGTCAEDLPVFGHARAGNQHHVPTLDFTAPASLRRRPRFSDSHSEPTVARLGVRNSSTPSSPAIRKRATQRRRASDPFDGASQARASRRTNIHNTPPHGRPVSAQLRSNPPSPPSPNRRPSPRTPIQLPISESSRLIDVRLREELQKPLTSHDNASPLATQHKRGVIYILKAPDHLKRGIKIGWTSRADYEKRLKEHRSACDYEPGYSHAVHDVLNSYRAERLIQIELGDQCKPWDCAGHHQDRVLTHEEWYDVTEDEAKEIVEKWTTFMNQQEPYDWRRQLSPLWEYLLRTRKINASEGFDHEMLRKQWKEILAPPTSLEYLFFIIDVLCRIWQFVLDNLRRSWPYCTAFFWQISTLVYSFVTLIMCRNTVASSAFAFVSVCACFSVAPRLKLSLRKVRVKGLSRM